MSPLAHMMFAENYFVEGSDSVEQKTLVGLRDKGIKCFVGHKTENLKDVDVFVYSSAISEDNVELQFAKNNGIECLHRADVLARLVNNQRGITIAGTHGKTTVSALTAFLLSVGGLDPSAAIGGYVPDFKGYHRLGKSGWFVAEADESDGSFLKLKSEIAVVLNIDSDHLDFYKGLDDIILAFEKYISGIKKDGILVYNCDDENVSKLASNLNIKTVGYSVLKETDFYAQDIIAKPICSTFSVREKEADYEVELNIPGDFNISNALAAIAAARKAGATVGAVQKGCREFTGVNRRFQRIGNYKGAEVIDDYAHHPREIKAVKNIADKTGKNYICIFQPHRYTRTKKLLNEFVEALSSFDNLILTDIYAASETDPDFSGEKLFEKIKEKNNNVLFVKNLEDIKSELNGLVNEVDLLLFLGAGSISKAAHKMINN